MITLRWNRFGVTSKLKSRWILNLPLLGPLPDLPSSIISKSSITPRGATALRVIFLLWPSNSNTQKHTDTLLKPLSTFLRRAQMPTDKSSRASLRIKDVEEVWLLARAPGTAASPPAPARPCRYSECRLPVGHFFSQARGFPSSSDWWPISTFHDVSNPQVE